MACFASDVKNLMIVFRPASGIILTSFKMPLQNSPSNAPFSLFSPSRPTSVAVIGFAFSSTTCFGCYMKPFVRALFFHVFRD